MTSKRQYAELLEKTPEEQVEKEVAQFIKKKEIIGSCAICGDNLSKLSQYYTFPNGLCCKSCFLWKTNSEIAKLLGSQIKAQIREKTALPIPFIPSKKKPSK